ncbi:hypothetical protein [uncultured Litoreibacter sp.]|uniref:hypothetical protein n=1 Tax=uncultured Litoreibacter sp. TaxID=1392394 RepID=UPI00260C4067|nr:hypothetical protein [uncultured Litoreibacter sp.]
MNVCVQRFHFEPGTLIEYDGYSVIVAGSGKAGLIIRDRFVGDDEVVKYHVLTDGKIQEILNRFDVVIDTDFSKNDPNDPGFDVAEGGEIPWENRSEADKKTAFQREAWCLAARSVLGLPPYTETLVENHYRDIKEAAHDRQRLNALGEDKNGEFLARSWGAKSVSNFCTTYFTAKVPHPKLLLSKKLKGNTFSDLTSAQNALLDKCCQAYLSKAQRFKSVDRQVRRKSFPAGDQRTTCKRRCASPKGTSHEYSLSETEKVYAASVGDQSRRIPRCTKGVFADTAWCPCSETWRAHRTGFLER